MRNKLLVVTNRGGDYRIGYNKKREKDSGDKRRKLGLRGKEA